MVEIPETGSCLSLIQKPSDCSSNPVRPECVQEYWVVDRFRRTLTVFRPDAKSVYDEDHVYTTPLLPGFELPLAKLFACADRWAAPSGSELQNS